ncbi:MAG: 4-alpha-glucanotransferase [Pseudomonadota bacterium]
MKPDEALARLSSLHGIFPEFKDMSGVTHRTLPDTQKALLRANGLEVSTPEHVRDALKQHEDAQAKAFAPGDVVVQAEQSAVIDIAHPAQWDVLAEADGAILAEGRAEDRIALPALPAGVHTLNLKGARHAQEVTLVAAPDRAPSVREQSGSERLWGVTAAFYGLRSDAGKSLADYDDLARFAGILGAKGAAFLGINPLHALGEAASDTISPYSPVHRGFLNTDHIALDQGEVPPSQEALIDYAAHRSRQRAALKAAYSAFLTSADDASLRAFENFCAQGGVWLRDFARFEALSAKHGPDARQWLSVADNSDDLPPDQLDYAMWAQWLADQQLADAQKRARSSGMPLGLYLDLAVGARLGGAEGWGDRSAVAQGVSLGAPPDHLSPAGQNWQLTALSPLRLKASRYEAFRFILRQNMRHAGVLRIDHALGLSRSFWLPEDGSPGGYIRQDFQVLMAIIAVEAQRAGTVIVGEDLGLVPDGFRKEMAGRGLYGYSVLQYEKDARGKLLPSARLRAQSLACFGTHDTPTLEGFWQGRDIAWWQKLGWIDDREAARAANRRAGEKRQLAQVPAPQPLPKRAGAGLRDSVHADLARSPAALVAVQLDDILSLQDAQNLPGTVDEHPNWRRMYPKTLSEIETGPELKKTAEIMAQSGRAMTCQRGKK